MTGPLSFHIQARDPKGIQSNTHSLTTKGLCELPHPLEQNILGLTPEYKSIHPPSKSTIPQPRLLLEETPTISR